MNTGAELYRQEYAVVEKARDMLDSDKTWEPEIKNSYSTLLNEYQRLLKRVRTLVRLSDRNEDKIRDANKKISHQQEELQGAYDKLSRQAEILEEMVQERTKHLIVAQEKIQSLIDLGIALSAERDHAKLLEMILLDAKELTNADGGSVYLLHDDKEDEKELEFAIVRNDSLEIALGGTTGNEITFPRIPLVDPDTGELNVHNVATASAIKGEIINIEDAYNNDDYDFSGTRDFDINTGYLSVSFLTLPMKARDGSVIGVLQLINAKDPETMEPIPFDEQDVPLVEALSSQAAVALENRNLLDDQRALMDSFIELIAGAIDEKSPYTGGHCQRVPELAMMLVDAACASEEGIFEGFQMNETQRYEYHIGTWLHDCGKVTTPEYVVDKATKLETIFNRIHEIRMRFEVLRRDAEIACLNGKLNDGDVAELEQAFNERLAKLEGDFDFIAECNIGGEFMSEDKQQRVREIAAETWTRHFDDRLGLSHEELKRMEREECQEHPCQENLLADKPHQIFYRTDDGDPFGDNPHGFNMKVPDYLYDYGEVKNLCIERGTLTEEERFKINDHIIQTISMLESLPFPKDMRRVPEFAGGHHEKMDGTGYPRGLERDQMSVPARIVGVADIFEALTASDRPYKKAKTLSEALKIMTFMRKDQHIDPDIFDLFLTSGAYQEYAEKYLLPEQIDAIEIAEYMNA